MSSVRKALVLALAVACLAVSAPGATAQQAGYSPGAPGIGDPYFPLEGNGATTSSTTTCASRTTRPPIGWTR